MSEFFHEAQRALQEQMETRRIADRIESTRRHCVFNDSDRQVIGAAQFFFLASVAPDGQPDCSVKCGPPGFVRLVGDGSLVFPDYDGNGMFRSLGNIEAHPAVALLFIEFGGDKRKLRLHGRARVSRAPEWLRLFPGAQLAVEVTAVDIFPNCPRYLPTVTAWEPSEFVAALGKRIIEPAWKSKPDLAEYVHKRRPTLA